MSARRSSLLAALLALAGLVVAATLVRPTAAPAGQPQAGTLAVDTTAFVCPSTYGSAGAPATVNVASVASLLHHPAPPVRITTMQLTGRPSKPTVLPNHVLTRLHYFRAGHALLVSASGAGAGAVAVDQRRLIPRGGGRGLYSTPCLRPGTDFWITGADGRVGFSDSLVLANAGSTTANITVNAWATTGPLEPPKLRSFTIAPFSALLLPVADYTPDDALVTLHVHANSGRITAEVRDVRTTAARPAGLDWIPPTRPPARTLVVPGIPAGAGQRRLVVANPGSTDATVTLHLLTASGNFAPAGHPSVVVRAGRTTDVDLTSSLGGQPGAVALSSDQPVTAAAVSQSSTSLRRGFPEIQWHVAGTPLRGPAVLPDNNPPFRSVSRIYLTAPNGAAQVRLTAMTGKSTVLRVPAGRTITVDPVQSLGVVATGPLLLQPVGGAEAYVSRTLYAPGAHGPLTTAEQPTSLPASLRLPPAVADLRAGIR
ncbi:MAG TPA: DUF5719 family protein [Mycobacteriales bacterium]|nr:DUF5719 family protein [Mycobacteriales bacterium]